MSSLHDEINCLLTELQITLQMYTQNTFLKADICLHIYTHTHTFLIFLFLFSYCRRKDVNISPHIFQQEGYLIYDC